MEQPTEGRPIEALKVVRHLRVETTIDQSNYPDMTVQEAEQYERDLTVGEVVDLLEFPDPEDFQVVQMMGVGDYYPHGNPVTMTTEIERIYASDDESDRS